MKTKKDRVLLVIILILSGIILFQNLLKNNVSSENIPSQTLLNALIKDRQNVLRKIDDKYWSLEIKSLENLVNICIVKEPKDSINKLLNMAGVELEQYEGIDNDYYKLIEYVILNKFIDTENENSFKFDKVQVRMFSNAQFKNNVLHVGENFEGYVLIAAGNTNSPNKIFIEGEDSVIIPNDNVCAKYVRPSTTKGQKEIKGVVHFFSNERERIFSFSQKYEVK